MRKFLVVLTLLAIGVVGFGQVTITFWHAMTGALGEALTTLVQKFMAENPTIKVDLVYQGGYSALQQKLIAAVAAKEPPTLAQQYENWTTQWLDALVDLDLFLPEVLINDILPQFDQRFEGRLVTVPFNKSILVLYYRTDFWPVPPKTWDEFLAMAKAVAKVEGGQLVQYGTAFRPANPEIFLTFLTQAGGSLLSDDWKTVTVNNEKGMEAAKFAAELSKYALVQSGYISAALAKGVPIGGWVDTSAGYTYNMSAAKTANIPLAVAPLPCYKNCASMIQGTNLAIFSVKQTKAQIEAAAKLIAFLLREDNTVYWAEKTGYLPVTAHGIHSKAWQAIMAKSEIARIGTQQLLAGGFGQLLHPNYMDMRSALITYWEQLIKVQDTPANIMNNLAAQLNILK